MKSACCKEEAVRQEPAPYGVPYYRCSKCKEKCELEQEPLYAGYHIDEKGYPQIGYAGLAAYDQARSIKNS